MSPFLPGTRAFLRSDDSADLNLRGLLVEVDSPSGLAGFDTANTSVAHVSSYTVYDASAHYDLGRLDNSMKGLSVAVEAKNLFNKDYLANCDGFWCYYGDERNVVASVNYKF